MKFNMDLIAVLLSVAIALAYLLRRNLRSLKAKRDWSTGRDVSACHHCPAMQIRKAQIERRPTSS